MHALAMRNRLQSISATVLLLFSLMASATANERVTVFAASSLTTALDDIGAVFTRETGTEVVFSFAGTGTLARQIEAGAPADVFVSADETWMAYAVESGAVRADTVRSVTGNSLVLVGSGGESSLSLSAKTIADHLGENRLAIADTETVPAGRYAKAALQATGLWRVVADRLAPMDNVRVALASVARGDTPLGVVYGSDAHVEPKVQVLAIFPAETHPEIVYPAALTTDGAERGRAFLDFLTGSKAQSILTDSGFAGIRD